MSLLMFAPLGDSAPVQIDLDFDLDDLDFRALSTEPTPAEALEPSLEVEEGELSPSLTLPSDDIWKKFDMSDATVPDRSANNSPVSQSVIDFLYSQTEQQTPDEPEEYVWPAPFSAMDAREIRHDCMWAGKCANQDHCKAGKDGDAQHEQCAAAAAAAAAAVAATAAVRVKCEPCDPDEATLPAAGAAAAVAAVAAAPPDPVVAATRLPVATTVTTVTTLTGPRTTRPQTSLLNTNANKSEVSLLKTNSRSLLISSRTAASNPSSNVSPIKNNASVKVQPSVMWGPYNKVNKNSRFQRQSLESDGDSPRPYTPPSQSESDGEDEDTEHPRFRHSLDMVFSSSLLDVCDMDSSSSTVVSTTTTSSSSIEDSAKVFCDYDSDTRDFTADVDAYTAVRISEVTGQICSTDVAPSASTGAAPRTNSNSNCDSKKWTSNTATDEYIESSRHAFMSDHSYHLSKGAVKTEHLGVQTPSDSEEEIDVVSVGEKQAPGRAVAAAALPTNPSARDRQQLQRTVASAITAKQQHQGATAATAGGSPTHAAAAAAAAAAHRQRMTEGAVSRARIPVRISLGDRTLTVRSVASSAVVDPAFDLADDAPAFPVHHGPGRKRGGGAGVAAGRGAGGTKRPRVQYQHRLQHHKPGGRGRRPRGAADDNEPDPTEKRSLHNDMERQRRIDLRNLVDDLRKLVPELRDNKRAAKVLILREAAKHCRSLREESRGLVAETGSLRRQQDRMMSRLSSLRRDLAAQRPM